MKTLIVNTYDSGYQISVIQIENDDIKFVNGDHYDLNEFDRLIDWKEGKTTENFKQTKYYKEFDKILIIDNAYTYQVK